MLSDGYWMYLHNCTGPIATIPSKKTLESFKKIGRKANIENSGFRIFKAYSRCDQRFSKKQASISRSDRQALNF